ncbi:hypothetical protein [Neptuniibacter sp. QD34_54]|uniref:hypothetical protein n=1 Tax=Neptuniibacter sp. QD34_54 TaxID=3398208 RepID=UPI0039F5368C
MKKFILPILSSFFLLSQTANAWDAHFEDTVSRVVVDNTAGSIILLLNSEVIPVNTGCTYNKKPRWKIDQPMSEYLYSASLAALSTGAKVKIYTVGCISGYPKLERIEVIK